MLSVHSQWYGGGLLCFQKSKKNFSVVFSVNVIQNYRFQVAVRLAYSLFRMQNNNSYKLFTSYAYMINIYYNTIFFVT